MVSWEFCPWFWRRFPRRVGWRTRGLPGDETWYARGLGVYTRRARLHAVIWDRLVQRPSITADRSSQRMNRKLTTKKISNCTISSFLSWKIFNRLRFWISKVSDAVLLRLPAFRLPWTPQDSEHRLNISLCFIRLASLCSRSWLVEPKVAALVILF